MPSVLRSLVPSAYRPVLANRVFRRLILGFAVSYLGDGMSFVAVAWLAIELAPPATAGLWVGGAVAAYTLPGVVGALAFSRRLRRMPARRLLLADNVVRGVFLGAVPLAWLTGLLSLPLYVVLLAVSSLLHAWGSAGKYVLTRATSLATSVTLVRRAHIDLDTLGYWEFFDRWAPSDSYAEASRADLERLYHGYRNEPRKPSKDRLRPYAEAVADDWLHPAGQRVLDLFAGYARLLNVPGAPEVHNGFHGVEPAALGSAANHLVAASGAVPPRLTTALLDLAPAMCRAEPVVVVHDARETNDFVLLRRVAARHDRPLHVLTLHDVNEGPRTGSLADLDRVVARGHDQYGKAVVRLGLRLYFIAVLGQNERQGFQPDQALRWIRRADRLLGEAEDTGDTGDAGADHLTALAGMARHGYVSPYDLTAELLNRRRPMPRKTVLKSVYL